MDAARRAQHDGIARREALGARDRVERRASVRIGIRAQRVQRFLGRDEAERRVRDRVLGSSSIARRSSGIADAIDVGV